MGKSFDRRQIAYFDRMERDEVEVEEEDEEEKWPLRQINFPG